MRELGFGCGSAALGDLMSQLDERYSRQILLTEIGEEGQRRLLESSVLIVGCGALGSTISDILTRAGVGRIRIADRDVPELHNLHRQVLFDEDDVAAGIPKAEAAARKLRRINSSVVIDALVMDVTPRNIEALIADVTLVLDGTDNFETRYVINDACVKSGKPWIYGGVIGTTGMSMNVVPGSGPCLRCLFPDAPTPGSLPTCDTLGVLNTAPAIIASIQATEACKFLVGSGEAAGGLIHADVWAGSFQRIDVRRAEDCPACALGRFDYLTVKETSWVTSLCGRNAVQITPARSTALSLDRLGKTLARVGSVSYNGLLLQFEVEGWELMIFPDGRVIVKGTTDEAVAKGLYAKYVGN